MSLRSWLLGMCLVGWQVPGSSTDLAVDGRVLRAFVDGVSIAEVEAACLVTKACVTAEFSFFGWGRFAATPERREALYDGDVLVFGYDRGGACILRNVIAAPRRRPHELMPNPLIREVCYLREAGEVVFHIAGETGAENFWRRFRAEDGAELPPVMIESLLCHAEPAVASGMVFRNVVGCSSAGVIAIQAEVWDERHDEGILRAVVTPSGRVLWSQFASRADKIREDISGWEGQIDVVSGRVSFLVQDVAFDGPLDMVTAARVRVERSPNGTVVAVPD